MEFNFTVETLFQSDSNGFSIIDSTFLNKFQSAARTTSQNFNQFAYKVDSKLDQVKQAIDQMGDASYKVSVIK